MEGKLLRDITGSVLVEYTIVFPLLILLVLGTIDVAYMLHEWVLANKAAYIGARTAVVADAVATGITSPSYSSITGQLCFVPSTGASTGNCPTITATDCTGAATKGSCTNTYSWNDAPFTTYIFARMQKLYPRLQRQNVTISYTPGTLGFNGQGVGNQNNDSCFPNCPNGLPMNVTVTINKNGSMTHQFFFIGPIMKFFGGIFPNSAAIPTFATTLPSEAMDSANL